jgi:flagellar basal-body rod protein FlgB
MLDEILGGNLKTLEKALDVRAMNHKLIASNIANLETPGYRALTIDFESTMKNAMGSNVSNTGYLNDENDVSLVRTDEDHFDINGEASIGEGMVFNTDDSKSIGNDSNSVSLEKEVGNLSQNSFNYQVLSSLMREKFRQINYLIQKSEK